MQRECNTALQSQGRKSHKPRVQRTLPGNLQVHKRGFPVHCQDSEAVAMFHA
jgi:hypothetical protein